MADNRQSGSMDPSPGERRERIISHALGRSHIEIAARFGITVQASKQFKQRNKAEIEEEARHLNGQAAEEMAQLWVSDQAAVQSVRQALIEDTLQRREDADEHRDVSRYIRDVDAMLYRASELAGLIKQRSQVEQVGVPTYRYEVVSRRGVPEQSPDGEKPERPPLPPGANPDEYEWQDG
jgi:hypothetical protein